MRTPANPRLPRRLAVALATLLVLVLAGCGPDDRPTGEDVPLPSLDDRAAKSPGKGGGAGGDDRTDRADKGGKGEDEDGGDDDGGDDDGGGGGGNGGNGGGGGNDGGGGGNDGGDDGGSGGGGAAPSGPPIPDTRTTLNVSIPADGSAGLDPPGLSAPAGTITIVFRNPGSEDHAIAVEGTEFPRRQSRPVKDGETVRLTVRLPPGEYEIFCPVDEHRFDLENPESGVLSVS